MSEHAVATHNAVMPIVRVAVLTAAVGDEDAGRLTEIALLGVVALRTGATLQWDGPNMTASNTPEAEPFIHGHFRKGWEI